MDRQTALDILESVRPGTADETEPEVQAATEAVRQDRDAAAVLARRQEIDCRIAAAMQDIAVPAAAKARLLARMLHAEDATPASENAETPCATCAGAEHRTAPTPLPRSSSDNPVPALPVEPAVLPSTAVASSELTEPARSDATSPRRNKRRLVAKALAAAAILMLVGLGVFWKQRVSGFGPAITLDQLTRSAPVSVTEPEAFTGRFVPALPSTSGWSGSRLSIAAAPQAARIDDTSRQVAAYQFEIAVGRGRTVTGWIMVAPADRITDPPPADSFQLSSVRYSSGLASVAWTEGNFVYVCVVRGGEDALQAVEWALDRRFG